MSKLIWFNARHLKGSLSEVLPEADRFAKRFGYTLEEIDEQTDLAVNTARLGFICRHTGSITLHFRDRMTGWELIEVS
jgi:hypothetical protein